MLRIKEIVRAFFCHSGRKLRDIRRGLGAANAWHSSIMHSACPSATPFPVTSAACLITRLDAGFLPQRQPCTHTHTHTHTHIHRRRGHTRRRRQADTCRTHKHMHRNIRPAEANRLLLSGEQNICKDALHHCGTCTTSESGTDTHDFCWMTRPPRSKCDLWLQQWRVAATVVLLVIKDRYQDIYSRYQPHLHVFVSCLNNI